MFCVRDYETKAVTQVSACRTKDCSHSNLSRNYLEAFECFELGNILDVKREFFLLKIHKFITAESDVGIKVLWNMVEIFFLGSPSLNAS